MFYSRETLWLRTSGTMNLRGVETCVYLPFIWGPLSGGACVYVPREMGAPCVLYRAWDTLFSQKLT